LHITESKGIALFGSQQEYQLKMLADTCFSFEFSESCANDFFVTGQLF
jgi:hypothetical protein